MLLPGIVLLLVGYAFWYTGVSNLSNGSFTQGNVQGLATSLGLDRILAKAGQPTSSGPVTTGVGQGAVDGAEGLLQPLNGGAPPGVGGPTV